MTKSCENCGQEMQINEKTCPNCGYVPTNNNLSEITPNQNNQIGDTQTEEKEIPTETTQDSTQETAIPPNTSHNNVEQYSKNKKTTMILMGIVVIVLVAGLAYMLGSASHDDNTEKSYSMGLSSEKSSYRNDPIVGRWEITELSNVDVEGYGGYIKFESSGSGSIYSPLGGNRTYFTWEFDSKDSDYRHYLIKNSSGNLVGVASIDDHIDIGVLSVGDEYIVFEK